MKKTTAASVLASLLACMSAGAVSFEKIQTYTPDTFTDVSADAWYAADVAGSFEMGLMKGTGGNRFEPEGTVTVAEAITMASRVSAVYARETIPEAEGEWYDMYVSYAKSHGFVGEGQFAGYDVPATRAEVASLFANALPVAEYTVKNDVTLIPDVPENMPCFSDIMRLYKAGIVMGSDDAGTFNPYTSITRAEAAAILNRVAVSDKRLTKSLHKTSADDAYTLMQSFGFNGAKEGITSGWQLDNRGGVPRTELRANYGALQDIRTDAGTAYIRPLNDVDTGVVTVNAAIASAGDGAYIAFTNPGGEEVLYLETKDDTWQIKTADGFTPLAAVAPERKEMTFGAVIDLDNGTSDIYFGGKNCGSFPLLSPDAVLSAFRFGTTKEGTPTFAPGKIIMTVNYAVHDDFAFENAASSLIENAVNASVSGERLMLGEGGSVSKTFRPLGGKVVGEFDFISDKASPVTYTLASAGSAVAVFTNDDKAFYVNGTAVYADYYDGLWYRVRLELDPVSCSILVKINGRKAADIPFAVRAASVDTVAFANGGAKTVTADDFHVFRVTEHEDYVPAPVIPKGEENYTVGMNVCSLWREGSHYGWACITPFDDVKPVLGYYDEGNPETADWEIKFLAEHGIDFQAFCVFFRTENPKRLEANHLFDGFMNAKYSELTHYCIIFEAANGMSPSSLDEWQSEYIPYIVENFLKDERYMVIDNKPVMCVFGHSYIASRIGGEDKAAKAFEMLEDEARKLGFDGMLYLACGSTSEPAMKREGYDGCYAYSWGVSGYQGSYNRSCMINSANEGSVYQVPTVSVGYNEVGWTGSRHPLMSINDYAATHAWVKESYLSEFAKEPWQENFIMLSTWNEYGEGTYIMPAGLNGFGYLEEVRKAYTSESTASDHSVPTGDALRRITRMYPQDVRLLRKEGYYDNEVHEEEQTVHAVIDYSETKANTVQISDVTVNEEGLSGTTNDTDPTVTVPNLPFDVFADKIKAIRVTLSAPTDSYVELFYTTSDSPTFTQNKTGHFTPTTSGMQSYTIMTDTLQEWTGRIKGIRIDPCAKSDREICIKSVEFIGDAELAVSKTVNINGKTFESSFAPVIAENGDVLVAFEPSLGMDFRLALYHTWDKASGTLTLMNKDHTAVFTVGKDTYSLDGKTQSLGYVIPQTDGIPFIPLCKLCRDFGYTYEDGSGKIVITTYENEYFAARESAKKPGSYEFEGAGDAEGFVSSAMSLVVEDGYMRCTSVSDSTDPTILSPSKLGLRAKKYGSFEIRVRYKYEAKNPNLLILYFITDKDGSWGETKKLYAKLKSTDSNGEWETYTVDLTQIATWKDTVTRLRFDPFDAVGTMDVDYMRFIENPDYDASADVEEEEQPVTETVADDAPFTLANPDASGSGGFISSGGEIEIVRDEDREGDPYFRNLPTNDNEIWLYALQYVKYRAGQTYNVSCDVRLASNGTDTEHVSSLTAYVMFNAQYENKNHVESRIQLSGDAWKHWTFTFTVPESSKDRSADSFAFYSDPVNGKGVGFCLDNIVVTEVE